MTEHMTIRADITFLHSVGDHLACQVYCHMYLRPRPLPLCGRKNTRCGDENLFESKRKGHNNETSFVPPVYDQRGRPAVGLGSC